MLRGIPKFTEPRCSPLTAARPGPGAQSFLERAAGRTGDTFSASRKIDAASRHAQRRPQETGDRRTGTWATGAGVPGTTRDYPGVVPGATGADRRKCEGISALRATLTALREST